MDGVALNETPRSLLSITAELGYTAYLIEDVNILSIYPYDMFPIYADQDVLLNKELLSNVNIVSRDYPDDKMAIE